MNWLYAVAGLFIASGAIWLLWQSRRTVAEAPVREPMEPMRLEFPLDPRRGLSAVLFWPPELRDAGYMNRFISQLEAQRSGLVRTPRERAERYEDDEEDEPRGFVPQRRSSRGGRG